MNSWSPTQLLMVFRDSLWGCGKLVMFYVFDFKLNEEKGH